MILFFIFDIAQILTFKEQLICIWEYIAAINE